MLTAKSKEEGEKYYQEAILLVKAEYPPQEHKSKMEMIKNNRKIFKKIQKEKEHPKQHFEKLLSQGLKSIKKYSKDEWKHEWEKILKKLNNLK